MHLYQHHASVPSRCGFLTNDFLTLWRQVLTVKNVDNERGKFWTITWTERSVFPRAGGAQIAINLYKRPFTLSYRWQVDWGHPQDMQS